MLKEEQKQDMSDDWVIWWLLTAQPVIGFFYSNNLIVAYLRILPDPAQTAAPLPPEREVDWIVCHSLPELANNVMQFVILPALFLFC